MMNVEMTTRPSALYGRYTGFEPTKECDVKERYLSYGRYTASNNYGIYKAQMDRAYEEAKTLLIAEARKRLPDMPVSDQYEFVQFDLTGIPMENEQLMAWARFADRTYHDYYKRGQPNFLIF